MYTAQRFKALNERCKTVSRLIEDADRCDDPIHARVLYRRARDETETVNLALYKLMSGNVAESNALRFANG